ncbi:uncharacterized protein LOC133731141 [Rosa rugosa]|uniref:uncharacterized protein LOC133731141 n=1 Tax=Rosa rugosa TaxID=74645 RepID=UPI002B413386|nr:uncharacterized protein LOC133731141 [Rosa rugosa]
MAEQSEVISQFQPHVAAQLVPVKLTEDNYSLWKSLLVPLLKKYDMFNMVQGTEQPLTEDKDQKCMSFMKLTLSEAMLPYAAEASSSSRALWLKLEQQGDIAESRLFLLKSRLTKLKKGKLSMSDYYQSAKQMADRLKAGGSPVADGDFLKHVLNGLPSDYDNFANLIRAGTEAITTPEELHDILVGEESSRRGERCRKVIKYGAFVFVGYLVGYVIGWEKGWADARRT